MFGIGRLIVGTSGSPGSLHALRYGEVLARAHDAVLIPVIAWEVPGEGRGRIQPASELGLACRDLACQRLREALVAVWGEVPEDPLVQPHVERGPAGWVLVNLACRPDDVLVVGAGRQGVLARLPFSRVSRYCLAHAQCPVLAVPPPALARDSGMAAWHGRSGVGHSPRSRSFATETGQPPEEPAHAGAVARGLLTPRAEQPLGGCPRQFSGVVGAHRISITR